MEQRQRIILALAGDRAAREQLFDENIQPIYYLCWKLTGSAARAGETTRCAFARAFSTLDELRPEVSFDRWITAIAVALCRQTVKTTQPGLFSADAREPAAPESAVDEACLPRECVTDPLMRADALRAVSMLPPVQRMTVVLRYAALMQPRQIAKLMEVDESTVLGRLNCGRRALTEALPCDAPAALLPALFAAEAAALRVPESLRSSCLHTALAAGQIDPPEETADWPQALPETKPAPSGKLGAVAAALVRRVGRGAARM